MVKSRQIYTPQSFVGAVTGHYFIFQYYDVVTEIHDILKENGIETEDNPLWDYPLDEIEHIVENNLNVVLVDCTYVGDNCKLTKEYRWFEVPEGFEN